MLVKRIALQHTHLSSTVSQLFNPKVEKFAILAHFCLPGHAPRTIAVNVTWIEREFNAGQTPRSTWFNIADTRKKLTQEKRAR